MMQLQETIASLWGEKLKELVTVSFKHFLNIAHGFVQVRDQLPATRENARAALSLIMSETVDGV